MINYFFSLINDIIGKNKKYRAKVLCEPQMSRYKLYPTQRVGNLNKKISNMMDFLSLCDGNTSLIEIADFLKVPIWDLYDIADKLISHKLIKANNI